MKTIDNKTFKECSVVMLYSNFKIEKGQLGYIPEDNFLGICENEELDRLDQKNDDVIAQHLYIISNEKIKLNDWVYFMGSIKQCDSERLVQICKDYEVDKIIASTDKSLELPQIPQQFIEQYIESYNKGDVIDKVMVEYQDMSQVEGEREISWEDKLVVNPDNTINILKQKDTYSREEVINLLHKRMKYSFGLDYDESTTIKWIEQNL